MKRFRFIWRDGKTQEADGDDVAGAFSSLGYGAGAVRALDYYRTVPTEVPVEGSHEENPPP